MTVLILGGTSEARALAWALDDAGVPVVSSLAGAVQRPRLPVGEVRVGGFGGVPGMCAYLQDRAITAVVDATHPFAGQISANAAAACRRVGLPLLRLERPGWAEHPLAATWTWVADHPEAARVAAESEGTVLLTTGRRHLEQFVVPLADHRVVVRVVDPVEAPLPSGWQVVQSRGPYDVEAERKLLRENDIRTLVTKDSGGALTAAKLEAAAALDVRVVIVRRPALTPSHPVSTPQQAADWVHRQQLT